MGILKVCENNTSCVGNFEWALLKGKEKESKKQDRKVEVGSATFSRALEAFLSFLKALP
jgi:hypothetical protein